MGELVRQVLVDLMKDDLIFVGCDRLGELNLITTIIFDEQKGELNLITIIINVEQKGETVGARQLLHQIRLRD